MALTELPAIMRLDLAVVELPESRPAATLGRSVPVYGFVIDHPDGVILVDTGVGFDHPVIENLYQPRCRELGELLEAVGIDRLDVVAVVNSHLHFDHCGQNPSLFDSSTRFFAQHAELDVVANDPTYTIASWAIAPSRQQRTVHGDEEIAEGITLLATPGHTHGHQSVLIEAANRRVVIGAQVVWHRDEISTEVASPANVDPDPDLETAAVESIRRLKSLRPEAIHLSHCETHHP